MTEERDALAETRAMTVGELMDMRDALDAAFAAKLGKKPASGFNVEIKTNYPDRVKIWGGYASFEPGFGAVVESTDWAGETPKEVFDYCMQKIEEHSVPSKEDKIRMLREQIEALEND